MRIGPSVGAGTVLPSAEHVNEKKRAVRASETPSSEAIALLGAALRTGCLNRLRDAHPFPVAASVLYQTFDFAQPECVGKALAELESWGSIARHDLNQAPAATRWRYIPEEEPLAEAAPPGSAGRARKYETFFTAEDRDGDTYERWGWLPFVPVVGMRITLGDYWNVASIGWGIDPEGDSLADGCLEVAMIHPDGPRDAAFLESSGWMNQDAHLRAARET